MQGFLRWLRLTAVCSLVATGCATSSRAPATGATRKPALPSARNGIPAKPKPEPETELPIQAIAHYAAGLALDLSGQSDQALDEYVESALTNPTHEPVVVEAARRCLRSRKADKAIEILLQATASPTASGALYGWLGLAYGQAGKTDLAIRANRVAIKKLPHSLPAYQNLAQIYLQNHQTNEALRVLNQAAQQPSVDAGFLVELAELYARFSKMKNLGDESVKERAVQALDRAAKLNSTNPVTLQKLADGYLDLGAFAKAEEGYSYLLKTYPQLSFLRGKLADLYIRMGRKDKAAEQLEAIVRAEPANARTLAFLGSLALEENKVEDAVRHFESALVLSPDLEHVYYELAAVKIIHRKKPEEGLALLGKARSRFKPGFAMEFYSGLAHFQLKKYGEAVKDFTSAELIARTEAPNRLTHPLYYQLGAACERNGDLEQAEKYFQKCLELDPDSADAMNYLGYMWAERGMKLEQARVLIQRAVELEPNNAAFLDSLAWVLFKLNQPKEALTYLLRAIEKSDEPDATLYDHLGDIYATLEESERAREAWQKSLSVEPNEKIKEKLAATPAPDRSQP
ncbi:MAG: tetratricopeptide repeat protein [Verrucomicrobia bacterium]|nr:tetratricopeptide repeat protein [Verrucomicrobiota bacterium]